MLTKPTWKTELPRALFTISVCMVGVLGVGEIVRSTAVHAQPQGHSAPLCPAGFVAQAKVPQTAAIRNLGGTVEHQTATGEDAIENICVKAGTQDGKRSPASVPPKSLSKPKKANVIALPSFDPNGVPCNRYILTQEVEHNIIINNSSLDVAPFSPPPGTCIVNQNVVGNYTSRSGVVRNTDSQIVNQSSSGNVNLDRSVNTPDIPPHK